MNKFSAFLLSYFKYGENDAVLHCFTLENGFQSFFLKGVYSAKNKKKAYLAPLTYTIIATVGVGGTITPNGIASYNYGVSQNYVINAAPGHTIATITVDGMPMVVPANTTSHTHAFANITANHTIAVSFTPTTYTNTKVFSLMTFGNAIQALDYPIRLQK